MKLRNNKITLFVTSPRSNGQEHAPCVCPHPECDSASLITAFTVRAEQNIHTTSLPGPKVTDVPIAP